MRFLSTKAAYLLYVLRPGKYSRALMAHIRPRLSTGLSGLPSGIHEISGDTMQLTDINTNAIVLEAIAHALGGGPALSSDENGQGESQMNVMFNHGHGAKLAKSLNDRTATVAVIGLGYVGLPLAAAIAASGFRVVGFDIDINKVEMIAAGRSYIDTVTDGDVAGFGES